MLLMVPNNDCRMLIGMTDRCGGNVAVAEQAVSVDGLAVDHAWCLQALRVQALGGSTRSLKASLTMWSRTSPGQPAMSSTKRRRSSANNAREASSKPARLPAMTDMK